MSILCECRVGLDSLRTVTFNNFSPIDLTREDLLKLAKFIVGLSLLLSLGEI